ncbi:MAG: hypothetical protein FWG72_03735 [Oscillospiraceae bacterium]|nr:hypothetical protein [Oscillospiraceae bacterium]
MSKMKLTKEEVNVKLNEAMKAGKLQKSGKTAELSAEQLEGVTGGVGAWAFEHEGDVWSVVCNKNETTNALLENCLVYEKACQYASPGATSCFNCQHFYIGNLGIRTE